MALKTTAVAIVVLSEVKGLCHLEVLRLTSYDQLR